MPPTVMSSAHDMSTSLLDRSGPSVESNIHRQLYINALDVHAVVQPTAIEWGSSALSVRRTGAVGQHRLWCLQCYTATVPRLELNRHRPLAATDLLPVDLQYNTQILLGNVCNWNFNIFNLDTLTFGRPLLFICLHLFNQHKFIQHFMLDVTKLTQFFCSIEEGYHCSNPYHNSVHAADVTQAMNCFIHEAKLSMCLTPIERLSCLLAAVSHDVDHPGLNQAFLVATGNPLVALYESTSVLENHHWRTLICLLHTSHVFDHFTADAWLTVKWQTKSQILATDITRQHLILHKFKDSIDRNILDINNTETDRNFVLQIALKCADISNPCRPWLLSRRWADMVCQEFYLQGDDERRLSLPVSKGCDRYTDSVVDVQFGFITSVVEPLFTQWQRLLLSPLSQLLLHNLSTNKKRWRCVAVDDVTLLQPADSSDDSTPSTSNLQEQMSEFIDPVHSMDHRDASSEPHTTQQTDTNTHTDRRASVPQSATTPDSTSSIPRRASVPVGNASNTFRKVLLMTSVAETGSMVPVLSLVEGTTVMVEGGSTSAVVEDARNSANMVTNTDIVKTICNSAVPESVTGQQHIAQTLETCSVGGCHGNYWAWRRGSAPSTCGKSHDLVVRLSSSPRHTNIVCPTEQQRLDRKLSGPAWLPVWTANIGQTGSPLMEQRHCTDTTSVTVGDNEHNDRQSTDLLCVIADGSRLGLGTIWARDRRSNSAHTMLVRPANVVIERRCSSPAVGCCSQTNNSRWANSHIITNSGRTLTFDPRLMCLLPDADLPVLCHT